MSLPSLRIPCDRGDSSTIDKNVISHKNIDVFEDNNHIWQYLSN